MEREKLTDAQWEQLLPLLPPQKPRTGHPAKDHRLVIEGILWVLRTGAPWRDVNEQHYGPWETLASRFYRWVKAGVWTGVLAELQRQADGEGHLDWSLHHVDGTVIRAHQHAAGAPKKKEHTDPEAGDEGGEETPSPEEEDPDEALGRSQGGFSTKIHLRCERGGKPLVLVITAGQRHEQSAVYRVMEQGAVTRQGRGRPRVRPDRVAGDKGYSSETFRRYLRRRRIGAVIPTKKNERRRPSFDTAAYRERNMVERTINRLKQFRRIATRYEKRAIHYRGMLTLAAILLWL